MIIKNLARAAIFAALSCCAAFTVAEARASKGDCVREPDFLLILGCRVKADEPEPTLKMRADSAAAYLAEHKNVIAICCGGIVHDDQTKSEAQAIFERLVSLGVEKERLILEDQSKTTAENFSNAKKIIDAMNLASEPKIAFISSEFHLLRAGLIGRIAGVKAESLPAPSPKNLLFKNYLRELIVFPAAFFPAN